ncbi:hypothetical protein [Candidatus Cryosericum septentrionale]|jgi:type I restriction enzyme R subunit|nr:hypothetical protein [Candidatus Cryosericum septentrionale]
MVPSSVLGLGSAGEREVQKALCHVLYVKYEMKDQDLFDKAYGYIAQYY